VTEPADNWRSPLGTNYVARFHPKVELLALSRLRLEWVCLGDHTNDMTSEDTRWRRVDQEWERVMQQLRKKATQELAHNRSLSEQDVDFYRIVVRLTDDRQN
jgi:hypothetical protein